MTTFISSRIRSNKMIVLLNLLEKKKAEKSATKIPMLTSNTNKCLSVGSKVSPKAPYINTTRYKSPCFPRWGQNPMCESKCFILWSFVTVQAIIINTYWMKLNSEKTTLCSSKVISWIKIATLFSIKKMGCLKRTKVKARIALTAVKGASIARGGR